MYHSLKDEAFPVAVTIGVSAGGLIFFTLVAVVLVVTLSRKKKTVVKDTVMNDLSVENSYVGDSKENMLKESSIDATIYNPLDASATNTGILVTPEHKSTKIKSFSGKIIYS